MIHFCQKCKHHYLKKQNNVLMNQDFCNKYDIFLVYYWAYDSTELCGLIPDKKCLNYKKYRKNKELFRKLKKL